MRLIHSLEILADSFALAGALVILLVREDQREAEAKSDRQPICRVLSEYRSAYPDPLVVSAGEELTASEKESSWSGWIWCTNRDGKSGWVPESYVERTGDTCSTLRL